MGCSPCGSVEFAVAMSTKLEYVEPGHRWSNANFRVVRQIVLACIATVVGGPMLLFLYIFKREALMSILKYASVESIKKQPKYQDKTLWQRVWDSPVGQLYLKGGLEYQLREGYCMPSTLRNILRSIPTISSDAIPPAKAAPSTADNYATKIDAIGYTTSRVVYGSDGYEAFVEALQHANDPQYRVAVNFLRSPIFGAGAPWFLPHNLLLALVGGHFSFVVGYLPDEDLVAVFDVNHTYGPFLVPTRRLFNAVSAHDLQSGKSRALVVSKLK
ncbi:unnamed protein product [Aphanomyces euteiches]